MATSSSAELPRSRKRPRARAPEAPQLGSAPNTGLEVPLNDIATGTSSGRSTPIPVDAPPSVKYLSSARKQARAEQRKRIFPTIEFASRVSHFDPSSDYGDFHGVFNLFWIGLTIMDITTMLRNIKDTGYPMRIQIWSLFTIKLWHLALVDFLMVATTGISVPVQKSLRTSGANGGMTWARSGMVLQSIYEVMWLAVWIALPFAFDWTWTAQVFLLLHTMVLLMKMHSYAFYNGHLSETELRLRALDNPSTASKAPAYIYPTADSSGSIVSPTQSAKETGRGAEGEVTKAAHASSDASGTTSDPGPGDDDEMIQLREVLARELTSPIGNTTFPHNLTWSNFTDYIFCPTLCYELEYPRMDKVDWSWPFSLVYSS